LGFGEVVHDESTRRKHGEQNATSDAVFLTEITIGGSHESPLPAPRRCRPPETPAPTPVNLAGVGLAVNIDPAS
jgi:hypothetical protein